MLGNRMCVALATAAVLLSDFYIATARAEESRSKTRRLSQATAGKQARYDGRRTGEALERTEQRGCARQSQKALVRPQSLLTGRIKSKAK
jgi:hypothetical protein